jgi:hypothetical protein
MPLNPLEIQQSPIFALGFPGQSTQTLSIRTNENVGSTLAKAKDQIAENLSITGVEFRPLSRLVEDSYRVQRAQSGALWLLAGLTAILLAVAAAASALATAEVRHFELSMRRVLGASIPRIVQQLANELAVGIILATALGSALVFLLVDVFRLYEGPNFYKLFAIGAGLLCVTAVCAIASVVVAKVKFENPSPNVLRG